MNKWVSVGISAVVTFFITAGTAYLAVGGSTFPTSYQLSVLGVGGLVAAARDVQHNLSEPPP